MINHHMVSAEKLHRRMMLDIHNWRWQYWICHSANDVLIIVSDHWISRSKNGSELLHWWMGELPNEDDGIQPARHAPRE
ncbi:hypothetical protein O9992_28320 [Vibrio lentus]|nr:hypothetical protein [Vibrio lentus]